MHDLPFTCHSAGAANGSVDGKAAGVAAQIQDTLASRQALHQGTAVPLIRIEACRFLSLPSGCPFFGCSYIKWQLWTVHQCLDILSTVVLS